MGSAKATPGPSWARSFALLQLLPQPHAGAPVTQRAIREERVEDGSDRRLELRPSSMEAEERTHLIDQLLPFQAARSKDEEHRRADLLGGKAIEGDTGSDMRGDPDSHGGRWGRRRLGGACHRGFGLRLRFGGRPLRLRPGSLSGCGLLPGSLSGCGDEAEQALDLSRAILEPVGRPDAMEGPATGLQHLPTQTIPVPHRLGVAVVRTVALHPTEEAAGELGVEDAEVDGVLGGTDVEAELDPGPLQLVLDLPFERGSGRHSGITAPARRNRPLD